MPLFFPDRSFFGLDIGSKMIKLVQLKPKQPKPTLVVCNATEVDEKLVLSQDKNSQRELASIIKQLVRDSKVSTQNVVFSLSATSSFNTVINLPPMPKAEIAKAIPYQAGKILPDGGKNMRLDWHVLKKSDNGLEVRIVAAREDVINNKVAVLEMAGLQPLVIELDSIASARSIVSPNSQNFVMIDIGYMKVEIAFVAEGVVKFIHSMETGGKFFERALEKELGIDNAQAKQFKFKFGLKEDKLEGHILKILKPYIDDIVGQADKTIKSFVSQNKNISIDHIYLCGGESMIPGLLVYVSSALGIEAHLANPWQNLEYPAELQAKLGSVAPLYATAVGLAMRGIND